MANRLGSSSKRSWFRWCFSFCVASFWISNCSGVSSFGFGRMLCIDSVKLKSDIFIPYSGSRGLKWYLKEFSLKVPLGKPRRAVS